MLQTDRGYQLGTRTTVPTILLVEDDPTIRHLLVELLSEERCYRILAAASADEAVALAATCCPDLFLFDYSLPGRNGLELYDSLHAQLAYQRIPAIMLSAALPSQLALQTRAIVGIEKPFDLDDVLAHICRALTK